MIPDMPVTINLFGFVIDLVIVAALVGTTTATLLWDPARHKERRQRRARIRVALADANAREEARLKFAQTLLAEYDLKNKVS